jgi:phosphatidylserine/phosphatidylglycerophosphate/cardiolipin synthase-like enzyme
VTKRPSTRHKSSSTSGINRYVSIAAVVIVIILGGVYLLTGVDPLGLFEGTPVEDTIPPDVIGSGGDWWQVYFTDPARVNDSTRMEGSVPGKLIEYINQAQETIHVASFEFNLTPVAEALIAAKKRGVEVQWITDDEHGLDADEEMGHGQFAMLERAGIEVRDDRRAALMHNKFWIFDGRIVWTGSTNITDNGGFRNNNNVLVIESPAVGAFFGREFDEMWAGKFGPTSPSTVSSQTTVVDGTPIQVLFASEDDVIEHIVPLIERAESSIRFMAFSFTHDDLGAAVLARAKAGVDVRGIFETRGSETEYSELGTLYCAQVPVRQDGNPGTFHHKVFVIDGHTLVTGSLNFSENADESNDENVVIVNNQDIAAQYLQEFDRRWAEAQQVDPQDIQCR